MDHGKTVVASVRIVQPATPDILTVQQALGMLGTELNHSYEGLGIK